MSREFGDWLARLPAGSVVCSAAEAASVVSEVARARSLDLDVRSHPYAPVAEVWACTAFLDGNPDRPLGLGDPDEI